MVVCVFDRCVGSLCEFDGWLVVSSVMVLLVVLALLIVWLRIGWLVV